MVPALKSILGGDVVSPEHSGGRRERCHRVTAPGAVSQHPGQGPGQLAGVRRPSSVHPLALTPVPSAMATGNEPAVEMPHASAASNPRIPPSAVSLPFPERRVPRDRR